VFLVGPGVKAWLSGAQTIATRLGQRFATPPRESRVGSPSQRLGARVGSPQGIGTEANGLAGDDRTPMDSTGIPMHAVTPEERDQFEKLGFFTRLNLFSETELQAIRVAAESVHQRVVDAADRKSDAPGPGSPENPSVGPVDQVDNQKYQEILGSTIKWEWDDDLRAVRSMEPVFQLDDRLAGVIDDPRLWKPCADIIGCPTLSLFSDKLNVKRPGGAPFPWHQEGPYWAYGAEDLERVITLILYLDDASVENGCLWIIPGTHKYGPLESLKDRGTLGRLYTDVEQLEEKPIPMDLPAGSVGFFHRDIVHGSQTNRTEENRRAYLLAYQPAGLHQWRNGEQRDIKTNGSGQA